MDPARQQMPRATAPASGENPPHEAPSPRPVVWRELSRRVRWVGSCWYWALRLLGWTWRKKLIGLERLDNLIQSGGASVAAFWHGNYLFLLPMLAGRPVIVFTSLSRRGDIIATICLRAGMSVYEIPHSGKGESYAIMRRVMSAGGMAVVAVDGPLGPYHEVKAGAVRLASDLGCPIIPIACGANWRKVRRSRWDRMQVPWPFSRVSLLCAEPMRVPEGLSEEELNPWRAELQGRLEALDAEADALLGNARR
ncbi:DUF374 domain-containing protein [Candidatus Sumerlaeota bacterium]|nr:DUF374 domain-containing protein [Candidatus Sumerlaeota bacterium]